MIYVSTNVAAQSCRVLDPELQGTYSGACRDGLAEGVGEATGSARYSGSFKAGRKHGRGVKAWPNSDRYEGDFVEDRREGRGTYVWGERSPWAGQRYTGEYRNDRRNGNGTYVWPDGDAYAGPWKDDLPTGPMTDRMIARVRAFYEAAAAVSAPGTPVCRRMVVGIATPDMIRGVVEKSAGETLTVRVTDAGRYEHTFGGVKIVKGVVITEVIDAWIPCVFPR